MTIVEPALPRFASITDKLIARGVVQNQTDRAGQVLVSLELDGKAVAGRADVPPANGSPQKSPAPSLVGLGSTLRVLARENDAAAAARAEHTVLTREVSVPAHGAVAAEFPVEMVETGEARWIWKARFADAETNAFTDAACSCRFGAVVCTGGWKRP